MKIAVLGATGNIGSRVVTDALTRGHQVVAYVRTAGSVQPRTGVTVIQGTLEDEAALTRAFDGVDAVISAIGVPLKAKKPVTLMRNSLPTIAAAVKAAGVPRFVLLSAFGTGDTAAKASPFARLIYGTAVKAILEDKELSERSLSSAGLNVTTVYCVNGRDKPAGPPAAVKSLEQVAKVPGLPTLSFTDIAAALLDIAADDSLVGRRVLVTTQKGWKPQPPA